MKKMILFLLFIFGPQIVFPQEQSLIQNVEGRKLLSLDGKWHIIIDPYENGYYDYRHKPIQNGYFLNSKPKNKTDRVEYDFDKSETMNVPGDWNSQMEKLFFYEGTVWYKKSFDYTIKKNKRVFIYFGAVNYDAIVFLNGERLDEHIGGFTPFDFEITNNIKDGSNFVIVKVDNKRLREGVPTLNTDWWNYGGITRDVEIVEVPETFVCDYFIQLKKSSMNKISATVQLDGKNLEQHVHIKIPEANIDKALITNEKGFAKTEFNANLKLWSPENPKLYDVIIEAQTDTIADKIGFRSIGTKGTEILLNGKPVFLRGISIHEEAPIRSGRAYSKEDAQTLFGWAKELGCNFVRLAHYPHNENMIKEAESAGIMVWSEIPVYWTIQWGNPATFENASNQLKEEITRDKNRAPIILWSVANETPRSEVRQEFLKKLIAQAKELDSTRLITAATETHYINSDTIMLDDPLGQYLDVIGCNEYIGWYDGLPEKADIINWKSSFNKPLIMSELGGGAKYGFHGDTLTVWSEEYQENLYQHQIKMLKRISLLRGMTPWILMDFRSPRRPLPGIQDFFNRKGLISNLGEKKKSFYVLEKFYKSMEDQYQK